MAELLIEIGRQQARANVVSGMTIGSESSNQLVIPLQGVLPVHARIEWDGAGGLLLVDDSSGTILRVNGVAIAATANERGTSRRAHRLQDGDIIELAQARMVFAAGVEPPLSSCGEAVARASAKETIGATCSCGARYAVSRSLIGKKATCKRCHRVFEIAPPPPVPVSTVYQSSYIESLNSTTCEIPWGQVALAFGVLGMAASLVLSSWFPLGAAVFAWLLWHGLWKYSSSTNDAIQSWTWKEWRPAVAGLLVCAVVRISIHLYFVHARTVSAPVSPETTAPPEPLRPFSREEIREMMGGGEVGSLQGER